MCGFELIVTIAPKKLAIATDFKFNLSHPFDVDPCRFLKWEQIRKVGWCMWMVVVGATKVVTPLFLILLYGVGGATCI